MREDTIIGNNIIIKKATDLHLENAQYIDNKLIFNNSAKAQIPLSGDILVGNSDDAYLKRVIDVKKDVDITEITVEDVAISQIVDNASFLSKIVLFDSADTDNSTLRKNVKYRGNNIKETQASWGSGRFNLTTTKQSKVNQNKFRKLEESNSDFVVMIHENNIKGYTRSKS